MIIAVMTPPLLNVTKALKLKIDNKAKSNNLLKIISFDIKNLTANTNIPIPNTVATWLGPKPPDVSKLDPVPVITSCKLGVYKTKYTVLLTMGNKKNNKIF